MGPYCQYCDHRCFVERQIIIGGETIWSGIMATCQRGKARDRRALGLDTDAAHNPREVVDA